MRHQNRNSPTAMPTQAHPRPLTPAPSCRHGRAASLPRRARRADLPEVLGTDPAPVPTVGDPAVSVPLVSRRVRLGNLRRDHPAARHTEPVPDAHG